MRHLALLSVLLLASACGFNTAKVLDIHSAKVTLPSGVTPSNEVTRAAILRALQERTWTVEGEEPNTIVASVSAGGHSATAGVTYDDLTYSIKRLESSPGLKFDGAYIHRRYNQWIKNLRKTIDKQLLLATQTSGGEAVAPPAEPPTGPVTAPPDGKVPSAAQPEAPPSAIDDDKMPPLPPPE
jgi:hypothetical protein